MTTVLTSELQKAILSLDGILPVDCPQYNVWSNTLKCVLIIFDGNRVLFSVTDRRVWLGVKILSYGNLRIRNADRKMLVIPYNLLVELSSHLTDENVKLIAGQNHLEVESAGVVYKLAGIETPYPQPESIRYKVFQGKFSIDRFELETSLVACGKYVSKNLCEQPLTGIHIRVDRNTAVAEASDGTFGIQSIFPVTSDNKFDFVMPASFPRQMLRYEWKKLTIKTYYDCIIAQSETGSVNFRCEQLSGSYPSDLLNAKFQNFVNQFDALDSDAERNDDWYWKNDDRPDGDQ